MTIFDAVDMRRWSVSFCRPPVISICCTPGDGAGGLGAGLGDGLEGGLAGGLAGGLGGGLAGGLASAGGGSVETCAAAPKARVCDSTLHSTRWPQRGAMWRFTAPILAAYPRPRRRAGFAVASGPTDACVSARPQVQAQLALAVHLAQHRRGRGKHRRRPRRQGRQHGCKAHATGKHRKAGRRLRRGLAQHGQQPPQRGLCSDAAAREAHSDSAAPDGSCAAPARDRRIKDEAPPDPPSAAARKRRGAGAGTCTVGWFMVVLSAAVTRA